MASEEYSRIMEISDSENYTERLQLDLQEWEHKLNLRADKNDYKGLIDYIQRFIEYVISSISNEPHAEQILMSRKCFTLIQDIIKDDWKYVFLKNIVKIIFDITIEENVQYWCIKRELLKVFNNWVVQAKPALRHEAIKPLSEIYLLKMVDNISSYADYDMQITIIETIFRMYGKSVISSKLKELIPESEELSQAFVGINPDVFDEDCRTFLNNINKKSDKIFSIICGNVQVGYTNCLPPMDNIDGLWVDFNLCDKAVSWYHIRTDSTGVVWELITLFSSDLENVFIDSNTNPYTIVIDFKLKGRLISSLEENQSFLDQMKNVTIIVEKTEEADLLLAKVLPKILGKVYPQSLTDPNKYSTEKNTNKPLSITASKKSKKSLISITSELSSTYKKLVPTSNLHTSMERLAFRSANNGSPQLTEDSDIEVITILSDETEDIYTQPVVILSGKCTGNDIKYRHLKNSQKSSNSIEYETAQDLFFDNDLSIISDHSKTSSEGNVNNIEIIKKQSKDNNDNVLKVLNKHPEITEDSDYMKVSHYEYVRLEKENIKVSKPNLRNTKVSTSKLQKINWNIETGNNTNVSLTKLTENFDYTEANSNTNSTKIRSLDIPTHFAEKIICSSKIMSVPDVGPKSKAKSSPKEIKISKNKDILNTKNLKLNRNISDVSKNIDKLDDNQRQISLNMQSSIETRNYSKQNENVITKETTKVSRYIDKSSKVSKYILDTHGQYKNTSDSSKIIDKLNELDQREEMVTKENTINSHVSAADKVSKCKYNLFSQGSENANKISRNNILSKDLGGIFTHSDPSVFDQSQNKNQKDENYSNQIEVADETMKVSHYTDQVSKGSKCKTKEPEETASAKENKKTKNEVILDANVSSQVLKGTVPNSDSPVFDQNHSELKSISNTTQMIDKLDDIERVVELVPLNRNDETEHSKQNEKMVFKEGREGSHHIERASKISTCGTKEPKTVVEVEISESDQKSKSQLFLQDASAKENKTTKNEVILDAKVSSQVLKGTFPNTDPPVFDQTHSELKSLSNTTQIIDKLDDIQRVVSESSPKENEISHDTKVTQNLGGIFPNSDPAPYDSILNKNQNASDTSKITEMDAIEVERVQLNEKTSDETEDFLKQEEKLIWKEIMKVSQHIDASVKVSKFNTEKPTANKVKVKKIVEKDQLSSIKEDSKNMSLDSFKITPTIQQYKEDLVLDKVQVDVNDSKKDEKLPTELIFQESGDLENKQTATEINKSVKNPFTDKKSAKENKMDLKNKQNEVEEFQKNRKSIQNVSEINITDQQRRYPKQRTLPPKTCVEYFNESKNPKSRRKDGINEDTNKEIPESKQQTSKINITEQQRRYPKRQSIPTKTYVEYFIESEISESRRKDGIDEATNKEMSESDSKLKNPLEECSTNKEGNFYSKENKNIYYDTPIKEVKEQQMFSKKHSQSSNDESINISNRTASKLGRSKENLKRNTSKKDDNHTINDIPKQDLKAKDRQIESYRKKMSLNQAAESKKTRKVKQSLASSDAEEESSMASYNKKKFGTDDLLTSSELESTLKNISNTETSNEFQNEVLTQKYIKVDQEIIQTLTNVDNTINSTKEKRRTSSTQLSKRLRSKKIKKYTLPISSSDEEEEFPRANYSKHKTDTDNLSASSELQATHKNTPNTETLNQSQNEVLTQKNTLVQEEITQAHTNSDDTINGTKEKSQTPSTQLSKRFEYKNIKKHTHPISSSDEEKLPMVSYSQNKIYTDDLSASSELEATQKNTPNTETLNESQNEVLTQKNTQVEEEITQAHTNSDNTINGTKEKSQTPSTQLSKRFKYKNIKKHTLPISSSDEEKLPMVSYSKNKIYTDDLSASSELEATQKNTPNSEMLTESQNEVLTQKNIQVEEEITRALTNFDNATNGTKEKSQASSTQLNKRLESKKIKKNILTISSSKMEKESPIVTYNKNKIDTNDRSVSSDLEATQKNTPNPETVTESKNEVLPQKKIQVEEEITQALTNYDKTINCTIEQSDGIEVLENNREHQEKTLEFTNQKLVSLKNVGHIDNRVRNTENNQNENFAAQVDVDDQCWTIDTNKLPSRDDERRPQSIEDNNKPNVDEQSEARAKTFLNKQKGTILTETSEHLEKDVVEKQKDFYKIEAHSICSPRDLNETRTTANSGKKRRKLYNPDDAPVLTREDLETETLHRRTVKSREYLRGNKTDPVINTKISKRRKNIKKTLETTNTTVIGIEKNRMESKCRKYAKLNDSSNFSSLKSGLLFQDLLESWRKSMSSDKRINTECTQNKNKSGTRISIKHGRNDNQKVLTHMKKDNKKSHLRENNNYINTYSLRQRSNEQSDESNLTRKRTKEDAQEDSKRISIISNILLNPLTSEPPTKKSKIHGDENILPESLLNNGEEYIDENNDMVCEPEEKCQYVESLVGKTAPFWTSSALLENKIVTINSRDYIGKFLVILFYPLDFAELPYAESPIEVASINENFEIFTKLNVEVICCSVDSCFTHRAWLNCNCSNVDKGLRNIKFPLLADTNHEVSKAYRIYSNQLGHSYRGFYIIDPKGIVIAQSVTELTLPLCIKEIFARIRCYQCIS